MMKKIVSNPVFEVSLGFEGLGFGEKEHPHHDDEDVAFPQFAAHANIIEGFRV